MNLCAIRNMIKQTIMFLVGITILFLTVRFVFNCWASFCCTSNRIYTHEKYVDYDDAIAYLFMIGILGSGLIGILYFGYIAVSTYIKAWYSAEVVACSVKKKRPKERIYG